MPARRSNRSSRPSAAGGGDGTIIDIDVATEMEASFLEYAYSVIYSRALPDARDGLKPVQRRILYAMREMGLRPEGPHVKCARVVGEVMGTLHPHGDAAIYDALVRMAQDFSLRLPLVDGHGNFGSVGGEDPPAAMRYTEARLAPAARLLTDSLDEDTVDLVANYDDRGREPAVLPAAFPNLLVNGASGIAVGMATNMVPHNLGEVVAAARHLLADPEADLDALMAILPGPDLPTGGIIAGLEGVREAYATGRGLIRMRATAEITDVSTRRKGIVVTELPFGGSPERIIAKIKELVKAGKLVGIHDVADYSDHKRGLQLVVEVKPGFHPPSVLDELYRLTPLEDSFGINNVALVEGRPRTLGLRELLQVFLDHRLETVRRRTQHRRDKAAARAHLVQGLLVALAAIEEVVAVIRASSDAEAARLALSDRFGLSEVQARYVLDMPLRRLTSLEVQKLTDELAELTETIALLDRILTDPGVLREVVSDELLAVSDTYATPRRTVLLGAEATTPKRVPTVTEIPDAACRVLMTQDGRLARTPTAVEIRDQRRRAAEDPAPRRRGKRRDLIVSEVITTARGQVGVITTAGRLHRVSVVDLAVLDVSPADLPGADAGPDADTALAQGWRPVLLSAAVPAATALGLESDQHALAAVSLRSEGPGLALATRQGVLKRVAPEWPAKGEAFEVITLRPGDAVVGAVELITGREDLVLISSHAQLLRTDGAGIRPQGRAAGGVAGIRLADGASVVAFAALSVTPEDLLVTVAGDSRALPGTGATSAKTTPLSEYPAKGRGTGGVRCHRFGRGEDVLLAAYAGPGPAIAVTDTQVSALPAETGRRDGAGQPVDADLRAVGRA